MRKTFLLVALVFASFCAMGQPVVNKYQYDINYFIPEHFAQIGATGTAIGKNYNPAVPQPKDILGFEIGEQFVDWNDVQKYMYALEKASGRVSIQEYGKTYQNRPFFQVIITSEANQKQLDKIQQEHLQLTDVKQQGKLDVKKMPVVVNLSNSIHGNEASGVNSSLATAYFFAASEDPTVKEILANTVIIINPGLNPDGINRFANWVNTTHSYNNVSDLDTREFSEAWPSSRTNHYWADCNRDWLMCQHPEGQNAVAMYLSWMPNVVSDHHEMGGSIKGFYFSPGHPKRTHPLTPQLNQDLTYNITKHTASALDQIGSLYFSKEGYDDFYLGKGAAYGDVQGSVGILYEQVASRGFSRPLAVGTLDFPFTVRNQSFAAITTVYASYTMREQLLEYQRNFYKESKANAAKDAVKGYVFNTGGRKAIEYYFLKNMAHHKIDVYKLAKNTRQGGKEFNSSDSYIIPTDQKYYAKIKGIWENMTQFQDSVFYDISTWTFPHAYNLEYSTVASTAGLLGSKVENIVFPQGNVIGGKAKYAYVFENTELHSHNLIADLLEKGLLVRISKKPFHYTKDGVTKEFGYGTAIVQLQNQPLDADAMYELVKESAQRNGVEVYAFNTGLMDDLDLGTGSNKAMKLPKVALITGRGMGVAESGEIWFMLDRRFGMPPALIDFNTLHKADLDNYNVIILAGGSPSDPISDKAYPNLKKWVSGGGTLILTGSSHSLASKIGVAKYKTLPSAKKKGTTDYFKPYYKPSTGGNNIEGVILNCKLDLTSPLGWGYSNPDVAIMKSGTTAFNVEETDGSFPLYYSKEPYLSGCISDANIKRLAQTPACMVSSHGSGTVICFPNDLNFRSYWFGATKIFMNAIFFGQLY
ncbi:MAG: peptidase M14 [Bacteroidales bacterium]|nr:peptidase M14 [Bacteroidales bacterium]